MQFYQPIKKFIFLPLPGPLIMSLKNTHRWPWEQECACTSLPISCWTKRKVCNSLVNKWSYFWYPMARKKLVGSILCVAWQDSGRTTAWVSRASFADKVTELKVKKQGNVFAETLLLILWATMRNIECSLGEGKIDREASPKKFASFSCDSSLKSSLRWGL